MKKYGELIIPLGIPGCGKSSLVGSKLVDQIDAIVSPDAWREKITGDINDQSRNDLVFARAYAELDELLEAGKRVYFDATNLTSRDELLRIAKKWNADTTVIYFDNLAQAVKRNEARERVVPEAVMDKMIMRYFKAMDAISGEGWTRIDHYGRYDD